MRKDLKANPPAAENKNAATPFFKGGVFNSPFLKGVAVPLLYTAGGFAFSSIFFNKRVFRR
jgi:hypothetical protein